MNTELMERSLPKWPQMIVTGTPVSEMQALEIIRRTDVFFVTILVRGPMFEVCITIGS